MKKEQHTDTLSDTTTDEKWYNEQIDRLLGWELLRRELTCNVTPVEITELCDSIGVNRNYVNKVLMTVKPKFQSLNPHS